MVGLVGLGNPGAEYEGTRHNIGYEILRRIAGELKADFRPGKGEYYQAVRSFKNEEIGLFLPLTYMNNSGEAVLDIRDRYDIPIERFLILCDDFQLPLGRLRLRPGGSDGGHNGLYSIIYHLKSNSFPRLRCGIASDETPSEKFRMADYVLAPFSPAERPMVDDMIERAAEASLSFAVDGLAKAMNRYNTNPTPKG